MINNIFAWFGLMEFSFLKFLKIIFIILFILLNIGLLYFEYLNNKNNIVVIKNGISNDIKKIASGILAAASGYSAYITITNDNIIDAIKLFIFIYTKRKFIFYFLRFIFKKNYHFQIPYYV